MKYPILNQSNIRSIFFSLFFLLISLPDAIAQDTSYYHLDKMGIRPNTGEDMSKMINQAIDKIKTSRKTAQPISIIFAPGKYNFHPEKAISKTLYISNHEQTNPKSIGMLFENMENVVVNGQGADLIFHGRMLPIAVIRSGNFALKNISIDFDNPQICQVEILENDTAKKIITFKTAPWVQYGIRDSVFYNQGKGWEINPTSGIACEKATRRIVYNSSDVRAPLKSVAEVSPGIIRAYNWKSTKLLPGNILALRSGHRPSPGVFLDESKDVIFQNISVHYAEGMGLLAQVSENITLDHFNVSLRGNNDPRYFTAQADATHFSGCKGKIVSINGLYEAMMDDAINIHGTYLKVVKQKAKNSVVAQYMHSMSYGFKWGDPGDVVQFIGSKTMETIGSKNNIRSITPLEQDGTKQFEIVFERDLDAAVLENESVGLENLTWTPSVYFANNIVRNNRARGALFSTPKETIVENNLFDHTSGSAILLCGDCNGWYETGACESVVIRNNRFVNALTSMFQFTNAIISIYPEIPELDKQKKYFHSGIKIENNIFETFDKPLVYAKSVDGLSFNKNKIITTKDYPAFHRNQHPFFFERVINFKISDNGFDYQFDKNADVKVK